MAIRTDTADKEVDATRFFYHLLIMTALLFQVLGITVQDMNILLRAVDMIEEIGSHKRVIALRMRFRQTYIFIHIEGDDMLERNLAFFYRLYQVGIHALR